MKPLIVHPGAHWSTHDCFVAMAEALRDSRQSCAEFRLDGRLARAHDFLAFVRGRMQAERPEAAIPEPTTDDITWHACTGLVERALLQRCDAIWIVTGNLIRPELIQIAREVGLKVFVWMTETPYLESEFELARLVDGVWTNEVTSVERFRGECAQVAYLPHAWRRGLHDTPAAAYDHQVPGHDVVFVGTYFKERLDLLEAVDWRGIDLGLYGMTDMIPDTSPLRPFVRSELTSNEVTAALYRRAKIGLNLYRLPPAGAAAQSLNPRAYELAAAGTFTLSEYRQEVEAKFGDSVPTFRAAADLEHRVRVYLNSHARRRVMAEAARDAVAADHWHARVSEMRDAAREWVAA